MKTFTVEQFRFISPDEDHDLENFDNWSRIYEYKEAMNVADRLQSSVSHKLKVHNTAWGWDDIHKKFRNMLDEKFDCIHSDITEGWVTYETVTYDITKPKPEFKEMFDLVYNISTIEHLDSIDDQIAAIENLFEQVKPGGRLFITVDYPNVPLEEFEKLLGCKCVDVETRLTPRNSKYGAIGTNLSIIYLEIKKDLV